MGHLINPVSYRLYNIRYWNNNWFLSNPSNYSYLINQDILLKNFLKKVFSFFIDSTYIGVIFVNLKIIRVFKHLSLYIYIHDSFLDLLFSNLKKNSKFLKVKKHLGYRFLNKYKNGLNNRKSSFKLFRKLKKKLILKYSRKFFFLFLKNKILKNYWNTFKGLLTLYLKKFTNLELPVEISIVGLSKKNVNADIVSEFFFIRLKQYYTIWEVLKNINFLFRSLMRKKKVVKGYKITCSGRFSRKQRTTYSWKSFGSLALSTTKSKLDYSFRTIALKYSACTVKVWVRLNKKKGNLVDFVI